MVISRIRGVSAFVACVVGAACAASGPQPELAGQPAAAAPAGESRPAYELTEADTVTRPIAMAAAGYLKKISSASRISISLNQTRIADRDLGEEIRQKYGSAATPRIVCVEMVRAAAGRPPSMPAGQSDNCKMEGADATASLTRFRRRADSAFVGISMTEVRFGRVEQSALCVQLVWRDQAWAGLGKLPRGVEDCGRR